MPDKTNPDLRGMAVRIAMSYTENNPMPPEALPQVIQMAYQGLSVCLYPPAQPEPVRRNGRGRPRGRRSTV